MNLISGFSYNFPKTATSVHFGDDESQYSPRYREEQAHRAHNAFHNLSGAIFGNESSDEEPSHIFRSQDTFSLMGHFVPERPHLSSDLSRLASIAVQGRQHALPLHANGRRFAPAGRIEETPERPDSDTRPAEAPIPSVNLRYPIGWGSHRRRSER